MESKTETIQPVGILDGIHGGKLRQSINDLIQSGTQNVLVDCSEITFMDSSGLSALVMIMRAIKQVDGKFAICSVNDQVKILLELTSMYKVLNIFPDQDAFLKADNG